MPFKLKTKNKSTKTEDYLDNVLHILDEQKLRKIADESLDKFAKASPTTDISKNWDYEIISTKNKVSLFFTNSTIQNGENLAIIIDVGHGTADGHWISGLHYLDKPVQETYEKIIKETWEALKRL